MIWDLINPAKTFVYIKCAIKLVVLITLSNGCNEHPRVEVWTYPCWQTLTGYKHWKTLNTFFKFYVLCCYSLGYVRAASFLIPHSTQPAFPYIRIISLAHAQGWGWRRKSIETLQPLLCRPSNQTRSQQKAFLQNSQGRISYLQL